MKNLFIYNQIKKDFLWDFSYKITFFGQFIGMFLTLIIFFFLGETFGAQKIDSLERYDNNYMLFAIIGVGVLDYISMLLRSLSTSIRNAQAFGYIDNIINSGLNELYVILCAMLYPLVKGLIKFSIYLIMASFLSDNELTIELYLTILLVLTVSTVPFIGVALIAGCFILVFKQGDPINYFVNIIVSIFSGIIYPVSVLPDWMSSVSNIIPLTHSLEFIRSAIFESSYNLDSNIIIQNIITTLSILVISMFIFKLTLRKIRLNGTTNKY